MVIKYIFFSEVEKESKEKHIWAGVSLPNRNPPQNASKKYVMCYISAYCLLLHNIK